MSFNVNLKVLFGIEVQKKKKKNIIKLNNESNTMLLSWIS